MTLPFAEETYTVSRLGAELKLFLAEAFPSLWVMGELQRVRASQRGHLYFELVEKGADDEIAGRFDGVLWRSDHDRVRRHLADHGLELSDEQQIRCRARLDFYPPSGRLQLIVQEVDPSFTEGLLARRRRETLEALAREGLVERNRSLPLAEVPLEVGLVTSFESAAYHDFLAGLQASGYGFRIVFVHAATQGRGAEQEIVSALEALGRLALDCVVLVRGGGARSDLAVFDSRPVAEAVALASVPVLTGVGHQIDQSIADLVAHRALKTPTMVAEFLVERVATSEQALVHLQGALAREGVERLRRERERLGGLAGRLAVGGARLLAFRRREPSLMGTRILTASRSLLRQATSELEGRARLCAGLAPERTLERGFSITRAGGRALRRADQVELGARLETQLAHGQLISRVEG